MVGEFVFRSRTTMAVRRSMARRPGWAWRISSWASVSVRQREPASEQHKRSKYVRHLCGRYVEVNQKLTLNYGLRWEPYLPTGQPGRQCRSITMKMLGERASRATGSITRRRACSSMAIPDSRARRRMYNQWWNFSPRLGFAWDVSGDGRTSVRASAGTFYDFPAQSTREFEHRAAVDTADSV